MVTPPIGVPHGYWGTAAPHPWGDVVAFTVLHRRGMTLHLQPTLDFARYVEILFSIIGKPTLDSQRLEPVPVAARVMAPRAIAFIQTCTPHATRRPATYPPLGSGGAGVPRSTSVSLEVC